MYRNVLKNIFHNVWKCTEKAISKVIWVGKGALDAILSQINKKIGDRFHFQWHRRRLNYQFSNYVTDKVNGSRVQPSLFGEDQRPDPGDGGNRAYVNINIFIWHILRLGRLCWNSNATEWNRLILLTWSRIFIYLPNTVGKRHKKAFKFIFGDRNLRLRDSAFVRCAPQQMMTEMT